MNERVVVHGPGGPPMPWRVSLFMLIPVLMGAVMIWISLVTGQQEAAYAREGVATIGTVTAKAFVAGSGDESDQYRLSYDFATPDGREYSDVGNVSRETYLQTDVGDTVTVTYLSSQPRTNRIGGALPSALAWGLAIVGLLMVLLGGGVLIRNSLRLSRGDRTVRTPIAPRGTQPGVTYVFRRPLLRIVVDLLGAPLGAFLFLGGVWFISIANIPHADPLTRTAFFLGFGFFGVFLLTGIPAGIRRGLRPAVLEVGPNGIWTPETGQLGWFEIAAVRVESVTGFAGDQGTATYERLSIVPVDPSRADRERRAPAWALGKAFLDLVRRIRPGAKMPELDTMSPFGVFDYDLGGSLDQAVAAVRRYRDVPGPESSGAKPQIGASAG